MRLSEENLDSRLTLPMEFDIKRLMKKLALFSLLVALPVVAAEVKPIPVRLQEGQATSVLLNGNPTTGFIWQVAGKPSANAVVQVSLSCAANEPGGMCCGFPTPTTLTMTALKPGKQKVRVIYARPWEKGKAPADEKVFAVEVTPAAR